MSIASGGIGLPPIHTKIVLDHSEFAREIEKAGQDAVQKANQISKELSGVAAVGKGLSDIGTKATLAITVPLAAGSVAVGKLAMDYESAFAGVRKTVDATEEEYAALSDGIRQMAKEVPTGAAAIAEVTEAAGQLGIEKANLLDFTKVMIDLGESTNLSATEGATQLARFANITKMSQNDFSRLGSVIVDLGNNYATTEAEIVSMGMRLAGAGSQVGMSEAQIMGFSAALSSVGVEAEAGGSAFSKLMINMAVAAETGTQANAIIDSTNFTLRELQMMLSHDAKEFGLMAAEMGYTKEEMKGFVESASTLEAFSQVTGKTADEFKRAFKEDAAGAIQEFIAGLAAAEEKGTSAIEILDSMGITEVRLRDSILRATGAQEMFTDAMDTANAAWDENTALSEEAAKRYETTESQMKILKHRMQDVGITIGEQLLPPAIKLVDKVADVVEWFGNLGEGTQSLILKLGLGAAAFGPVTKVAGVLLQTVSKAPEAFNLLKGGLSIGATALQSFGASGGAVTGVLGKVAGAAGLSSGALSGTGAALATAAGAAVPFVAAGATIVGALYGISKGFEQKAVPAVDLFADTYKEVSRSYVDETGQVIEHTERVAVAVDQSTQDQVNAFMALKNEAETLTTEMYLGITDVTTENIAAITGNVQQMAQSGIAAVEEQRSRNVQDFYTLYSEGVGLSHDEKIGVMDEINDMAAQRTQRIEETQERIVELYGIIKEKGIENATEEREEITTLMNELADESISAMARSADEQEVILNALKRNQGNITQSMVSETVQKLNKQRDDGVAAAQEQYDKQINFALDYKQQLISAHGTLTKDQEKMVQKMIDGAEKQKEESVAAYDALRTKGLIKLRDEYGDLTTSLDMETGKQISFFDRILGKAKEWNDLKLEDKEVTTTHTNRTYNETYNTTTYRQNGTRPSSYYNGLDNVPYDGYIARLHKDERVLTAKENEEYSSNRRGGVSVNIENFTNNTKEDIRELVRRMDREIKRQKVGGGAV